MYQTTISAENQNERYIRYLNRQVSPLIKDIEGISALTCNEDKCYLSLACAEEHKSKLDETIITALTDVLSVGYKNSYFKEKLAINERSFLQNVVVNTMCIFDTHKDKKTIGRKIKSMGNLSIEGYCNFRLKDVRKKWDEIIDLTSAYDVITSNKAVVEEFLIFLVESIPVSREKMSVVLSEQSFSFFDAQGKPLSTYTSFCKQENYQEALMHNLICYRPKEVYFVGSSKQLSKEFWHIAKLLFSVYKNKVSQNV